MNNSLRRNSNIKIALMSLPNVKSVNKRKRKEMQRMLQNKQKKKRKYKNVLQLR